MKIKVRELVDESTCFDVNHQLYRQIMSKNIIPFTSLQFLDIEIFSNGDKSASELWTESMADNFSELIDTDVPFDVFLASWIAGNRSIHKTYAVSDISGKLMPMYFPLGVVLVGGLSMLGKSTFLRNLASDFDCDYVVYGEPDFPCIDSQSELIKVIKDFIEDPNKDVLIIDSISEFFIAKGKTAAAAGGVNNQLLVDLPKLSNYMAMVGKTLILSMNYGDKNERVNDLNTAYAGKVAMYVAWTGVGSGSYSNRINRKRSEISFYVGTKTQVCESNSSPKRTRLSSKQDVKVNDLKVDGFTKLKYNFSI